MNHSKTKLAIVAVLAATLGFPALAAGRHSGGGGGGRAASGGGHSGAHHSGGHFSGGYSARHYGGGARYYPPRAGLYLGVPLLAAAAYYGPRYYYPPAYVAPAPGALFYCAAYNDYYPRVQVCPSGWQQVIQQPAYPPAPYY